jgi:hypothetical protein
MDLAFAMAAAGSYIFEDLILVFTAETIMREQENT